MSGGDDDELFSKSLESDVSNEETQNLLNEVISNTDTDLWDGKWYSFIDQLYSSLLFSTLLYSILLSSSEVYVK